MLGGRIKQSDSTAPEYGMYVNGCFLFVYFGIFYCRVSGVTQNKEYLSREFVNTPDNIYSTYP